MDPSLIKIQLGFFIFALVLSLFAAVNPRWLIRLLGRGHVVPSQAGLLVFRILAIICVFGTIYRLVGLFGY